MKKKILVFSDEIPPAGGGSGVIAKKITDNYIEYGHKVTLLSGDEANYNSLNLKHIRVKRITLLWIFNYIYSIFIKVRLNVFDSIIINDQMSAYISGLLFTKKQLSKCTIVIHGRDSNYFFNTISLKHKLFFFKRFYKRSLLYSNKIVAVSNWTKNEYLKYIPKDIKPSIIDKISWHFAGIDKNDLAGGEACKLSLNLDLKNKGVLISVGRLVKMKGYFEMLEIFSKNIKTNKDIVWLIVGDGPDKATLENKVSELGLNKNIKFLGKVPRNTLSELYLLADTFWLYSKTEAYGLVFLEAASYNLPSLGPCEGGVKEAIVENITGFYMDEKIDLSNALKQCIELKKTNKPSLYADSVSTKKFSSYLHINIHE